MTHTCVYIDADSLNGQTAVVLAQRLLQFFNNAKLHVFYSHNATNPSKEEFKNDRYWGEAATNPAIDMTLHHIQPSFSGKKFTDMAITCKVWEHVMKNKHVMNNKPLQIVIVSGELDYTILAGHIKTHVSNIVMVGEKRLSRGLRFLPLRILIQERPRPIQDCVETIYSAIISTDSCKLSAEEFHDLLVRQDNSFWPQEYGAKSTRDLSLKLGLVFKEGTISTDEVLNLLGRQPPPPPTKPAFTRNLPVDSMSVSNIISGEGSMKAKKNTSNSQSSQAAQKAKGLGPFVIGL
ncbi:hypothetical protein P9112_003876 [Eukaryota sp. TZLM1-RC]